MEYLVLQHYYDSAVLLCTASKSRMSKVDCFILQNVVFRAKN